MQNRERLIWQETNVTFEHLPSLSAKIANELRKLDFFCIWLHGNIGAGKTTLTGYILRELGLASGIPVTSPTFTYLSDYKIKDKVFVHLDFYRLESNEAPMSDLLNYLDYDGLFVEWPENLSEKSAIHPTHILKIEKGSDLESRNYQLFEFI